MYTLGKSGQKKRKKTDVGTARAETEKNRLGYGFFFRERLGYGLTDAGPLHSGLSWTKNLFGTEILVL